MSLEDRLRYGLWHRIRRMTSPYLLSMSLGIFGYACGNGSEPSQPQGCVTDRDCPDKLICEGQQCVSPPPRDLGDRPFFRYPSIPEETFNGFRAALQDNNRERAVQYFAPHVQESYRAILSRKNLSELARTIPELKPAYRDEEASTGNFAQYEVPINGEKYAVTFNCSDGQCKIIGF